MGKLLDNYNKSVGSVTMAYDSAVGSIKDSFVDATDSVGNWVEAADAKFVGLSNTIDNAAYSTVEYANTHTIGDMVNDGRKLLSDYYRTVGQAVGEKLQESELGKAGLSLVHEAHDKATMFTDNLENVGDYLENRSIGGIFNDVATMVENRNDNKKREDAKRALADRRAERVDTLLRQNSGQTEWQNNGISELE